MIVYQESYDVHNNLERRLFLNGKTYVEINPYSEEKKCHLDDKENDLVNQLYRDYRHYPETPPDFYDDSGMGLRYGMIINWVYFLYGGAGPGWAVKELYALEQEWLVGEGAKPLNPPCEVPEMRDVRRRIAWHHDGMEEETYYRPYEEI